MLDKNDFCYLVSGLHDHLKRECKMYDAIEDFGIRINTDFYTDYFWNTVWNILNEHYPVEIVDMTFNFICDGYLLIRDNADENDIILSTSEQLYNYINS